MTRTFASIGVLQLLVMLVGLLRTKLLSLMLGPDGVGIVATLDQAIVTLAQVAAIGLPFTAMKFMARAHSKGDESYRRSYTGFLRLIVSVTVPFAVGFTVLAQLQPTWIPAGLLPYRGYLWMVILGAPAFTLNILFVRTVAAAGHSRMAAVLMVVQAVVLGVATIYGAWSAGVEGLYLANFVAGVAGVLLTMYWLSSRFGLSPMLRGGSAVGAMIRDPEIVSNAAMTYVTLVAFAIAMFAIRYIGLLELGEANTGRMQAQLSIALSVGALVAPLSGLHIAPLLNRVAPVATKTGSADAFMRMVAMIFIVGAVPVVLFPSLVVQVLYSRAFLGPVGSLGLFVLWQLLYQLMNVYQQLLIGLDDLQYCAAAVVGGLALTIGLGGPFTRNFGINGIALALIAGTIVSSAAFLVRLRWRYAYQPSRAVISRTGAGILVFGVAAAAQFALTELTLQGVLARLAIAALSLAGLYALLQTSERHQLQTLIRQWRRSA